MQPRWQVIYSLQKRSVWVPTLLFSFCIIFGAACIVAYNSYTKAIDAAVRSNETRTLLFSKLILEHERAAIGVLRSYGSRRLLMDSVKRKDCEGTVRHLTNLVKDNPEMDWPFIVSPDGVLWANFPVDKRALNKDLSHRDWYKGVSREWKPYISSVYKLIVGEKDLAVAVAVPILDEKGKVIGILATAQRTAFFQKIIGEVGLNPAANITLIDQGGHIIYSNRFPYTKEVIDFPSSEFLRKAVKGEKGDVEVRDSADGNRMKYVSFAPVEGIGWSVIVEKSKSEVLRSEYYFFILIAAISFLIYVVIALSLIYLRRRQRQIGDLNRLTDHLETANKELEAFSYSVSHDLRAPLRSIDGFSLALLEDYADRLDDTGKSYFLRIRSATQKMSQLIDGMLNLSRLSRREMKREMVDLTDVARSIADELRKGQPDRQVEFSIAEGISALGDSLMSQVMLENLLGNAWKFTRKHPTARIEFGVMEGDGHEPSVKRQTIYYVRDDGAGFDMAYSDKLFCAFQRLHTAADFPGIGIGLTTVQRIIHRHGGRVWAEGEVEKGATFFFTLP